MGFYATSLPLCGVGQDDANVPSSLGILWRIGRRERGLLVVVVDVEERRETLRRYLRHWVL